MSQSVIISRSHTATVWLNFTRGGPGTTLAELEDFCAQLRAAGAQDGESVEFSKELSARLSATIRLPLPGREHTTPGETGGET